MAQKRKHQDNDEDINYQSLKNIVLHFLNFVVMEVYLLCWGDGIF